MSPYFDPDYFTPTYFDTPAPASGGHHAVGLAWVPEPIDDEDDDVMVGIL